MPNPISHKLAYTMLFLYCSDFFFLAGANSIADLESIDSLNFFPRLSVCSSAFLHLLYAYGDQLMVLKYGDTCY